MRRVQVLAVLWLSLGLVSANAADQPPIKLVQQSPTIDVTVAGQPFTTYHFAPTPQDPDFHRPYFWPVCLGDNVPLTSDQTRLMQQQKTDHPHHRSVWVAHGDVNGLDHWTQKPGAKKQIHQKFTRLASDGFTEELIWEGKQENQPVLTEVRTVRFLAWPDGARGIDVTSIFTAASGDVVFKVEPLNGKKGVEAGWLAVRVAPEMSADKSKIQITSSAPASTEKDARSLPANWCDFTAQIAGKTYGMALLDHPNNPGHPAPFHVRSFGFLSHIGVHDWTLPANQNKTVRHQLIFHTGDARSASLDQRYADFAK